MFLTVLDIKPAVVIAILIVFIQISGVSVLANKAEKSVPLLGKIVFVSTRDENAEIYTMAPDGSGQTRLTTSTFASERCPTWSPDGTKIAFKREISGNHSIMIMDADGSNQTEVNSSLMTWTCLDWSPNGERLLFVVGDGQNELRIASLGIDGKGLMYHSAAGTFAFSPAWSPDGQKIAFSRRPISSPPYSYSEIFTMNTDGTDIRMISRSGDYTGADCPNWSPDGTKIAFSGLIEDGIAPNGLALMNSDGSNPTQLISYENGGIAWPRFSPDGRSFVFERTAYSPVTEEYTTDIWTIENGIQTRLTSTLFGNDFEPDWRAPLSNVGISGRVIAPSGAGVRLAQVTITSPSGYRQTATTSSFGHYSISGVPVGHSYTIAVQSRRYRFQPQTFALADSLSGVDFIGQE